jgi:uncharacterized protein (DUF58 family)
VVRRSLRWLRDIVPLTLRGWVTLLIGIVCFVLARSFGLAELIYVGSFALALVALSFISVGVGAPALEVTRAFVPDVLAVGERATIRIDVVNNSRYGRAAASWRDRLPSALAGTATGTVAPMGGRQGQYRRARVSYDVVALRRGEHSVGPLTLILPDPFGMARRYAAIGTADMLTVLPRVVSVPPITLSASGRDGATRPTVQRVGIGDDDVIARPYQPGDSMRRLHWRATAHRGELMVRQEEEKNKPEIELVLDQTAAHFATRATVSTEFEWAVSAVASLASHLGTLGYRIRLRSTDGTSIVLDLGPETSDDSVEDALVELARVALTGDDAGVTAPRYRDLLGDDTVPCVLVLGAISTEAATEWLGAIRPGAAGCILLSSRTDPAARDVLSQSGWQYQEYFASSDLAELWQALGSGRTEYAAR